MRVGPQCFVETNRGPHEAAHLPKWNKTAILKMCVYIHICSLHVED